MVYTRREVAWESSRIVDVIANQAKNRGEVFASGIPAIPDMWMKGFILKKIVTSTG